MSSHVRTNTADRVADIEIWRPEKKNALTQEMYAAMSDALLRAEADPEVRVVLLHGQPDCFTAGNDLHDFLEVSHGSGVGAPAPRFLDIIAAARKPIVAAVGGVAVGIGTTMLLHCDLVYAAANARFQMPFVPLGLAPEGGSSLLLPMLAGYQRAAEMLILGRPFGAEAAHAAGLVNEVVPSERLLPHAREAALAVAALSPESVRITKELLKRPHELAVKERMAEEIRIFGERLVSPEAKAAMGAFFQRKKA